MRLSLGIGLSFVKIDDAVEVTPSSVPSSSVPSSSVPSSSVPSSVPSSSTPETLPCMVTVAGAGTTLVNGVYYRAEHLEDAEYPVVFVHASGQYVLMREADTCTWRIMDESRYYSYYWRYWLMCPGPEGLFNVPETGWDKTGLGRDPVPEVTPAWDGCPSDPYFWPCKIVVSGAGETALNGTYCREIVLETSIWDRVYARTVSGGYATIRRYAFNLEWYIYLDGAPGGTMRGWHATTSPDGEFPVTGWTMRTKPAPTFVLHTDVTDCNECLEIDPPPPSDAPSSVPSSVPPSWPVSSAPSSSAPSSSAPSSDPGAYQGPGYYLFLNQGWSCTEENGWVESGGPYYTCAYVEDEETYNGYVFTYAELLVTRPCVEGQYGGSEMTRTPEGYWGEDSFCGGS